MKAMAMAMEKVPRVDCRARGPHRRGDRGHAKGDVRLSMTPLPGPGDAGGEGSLRGGVKFPVTS